MASPCRLGLLALGDSITNGHGEPQGGLIPQSWSLWLGRALALPVTKLAADGASATDVVREQLPAIPGEHYDVGSIYVGANDVRRVEWDAAAYERDLRTVLDALGARCDRTLAATLPLDLGVPPAGAKVLEANAIVERLARERGTLVVDLRDFTGARWVWADRVHATALGQVEIADRAARALRAERLPSDVARPPAPDLGYRLRYARRALREQARAALTRR
jgi:lysophospholipase L1-like esterase